MFYFNTLVHDSVHTFHTIVKKIISVSVCLPFRCPVNVLLCDLQKSQAEPRTVEPQRDDLLAVRMYARLCNGASVRFDAQKYALILKCVFLSGCELHLVAYSRNRS